MFANSKQTGKCCETRSLRATSHASVIHKLTAVKNSRCRQHASTYHIVHCLRFSIHLSCYKYKLNSFYRAMLLQDVCLCVCLSVIRRFYVETAKHYIKLFSPLGSHTILVFQHQTVCSIPSASPERGR